MTFLQVNKLEVVYDNSIIAIQGVSFNVRERSIVTILGINGAGKSTTLRAVSGFLHQDHAKITDGSVIFKGEILNNKLPHEIAHRGVIIVPERDKIFVSLTTRENLEVGMSLSKGKRKEMEDLVYQFFPILYNRRSQVAGYLSGGERQMLALGKAVLCSPQLLLVDELSLGLAPMVVESLLKTIVSLRERLGISIIVVEQNAYAALSIAEYGYIMENGRVVFDGTAERLMKHEDVQEFYLGLSERGERSYRDARQYRRTRRWRG
jgi:branched-chain amino acid transport system ATP-binding protein